MLGGVSFSCDRGVNLFPWFTVNGDVGCDNLLVEGILSKSATRFSASSNFWSKVLHLPNLSSEIDEEMNCPMLWETSEDIWFYKTFLIWLQLELTRVSFLWPLNVFRNTSNKCIMFKSHYITLAIETFSSYRSFCYFQSPLVSVKVCQIVQSNPFHRFTFYFGRCQRWNWSCSTKIVSRRMFHFKSILSL